MRNRFKIEREKQSTWLVWGKSKRCLQLLDSGHWHCRIVPQLLCKRPNVIRLFEVLHGGARKIRMVKKKIKNLWRRKCVRRGIFRNVEVRVEGSEAPLNPYFVCNSSKLYHCVTCLGSSYTKNEYSLFYQEFDAEYFLNRHFFFQRKPQKTVLGSHLTTFQGKKASYAKN